MIETRDVARGVFGAWRLAHFDPQGMTYIDQTLEGFWKSFFAAVIVLPGFLAFKALARDTLSEELVNVPLWRVVTIEGIAYVISWIAFPLVMVIIADLLDRRTRYIGFIVAANWSAVVQIAVFLPATAIYAATGNTLAFMLFIVIWSGLFVYAWFIAKTALDISGPAAAGIVGLSFVLDILIDGVSGVMIAPN